VFLSGGDGEDTLDFSQFASGISVDLGLVGVVQTVVAGEMELYLSAEDVERVLGGAGDDTIIGNSLNNRLGGGHGNDVIKGGGGTNTLVEVADTDFALTDVALTSGLGFVDVLADLQQAELTGGASGNVLDASGFSGGVLLRGEGGDDQLVGGAAEDILIGGPGDDVLRGGQGDDVYRFDVDEVLGADTVDELPGGANGIDHLDFSETTTVGISVDLSLTTAQVVRPGNLTLTLTDGSSVEMVTGGDGDDVLVGNGLSNTFVGGSGSDGFFGNGGLADTVYEERDADFLVEDTELTITGFGAGLGTTEVDSLSGIHRVWLRGGDGNNVMDATAFSGRVQLEGLAGNDSLYGGAHDDVLVGGSGVDFLRGNGGDDLLEGGDGNDIYEFDQSFDQGMDTVVEVFGGGFADLLVGVGPAGVAVDLGLTTPQWISDFLTLTFTNAFQVEFSF
jgi:Ca2+-binding RTX toxin-like protein